MTDTSNKTKLMVVAAAAVIIGAALYSFPQDPEAGVAEVADNYPQDYVEITPVTFTDLPENIAPVEEEKVEPAFDPTGGHSPDTHPAITRFCNPEVNTAWSADVEASRRYYSPDLDIEVLVLSYTTGDWLMLGQSNDGHCEPIGAELIDTGLQSIDQVIAPKL